MSSGEDDTEEALRDLAFAPRLTPPSSFHGTSRYAVERQLGEGSFGVVFQVLDRTLGDRVALKLLRQPRPEWLYRFKREFRILREVLHPHLVRLYELASDEGQWFYTMELVTGKPLWAHARGSMEKVRSSLAQLAGGIAAVHGAGKLHRDLKPSNVMVDGAGRVVLLDFGLATDLRADSSTDIAGTPLYMSPEQAAGEPLTEASDWYALGVILYEGLTGRPPYQGTFLELSRAKLREDAPSPQTLARDVPDDLAQLCMALLARDPRARPSGAEVLACLDAGSEPPAVVTAAPLQEPFVGRQASLDQLALAYQATRQGRPSLVLVHGPSGIGKSALLQRFAREIERSDPEALVIGGRCGSFESVPYKALDPLVDALARWLARSPELELEGLLPRHVAALARLFPVLRQVQAIERRSGDAQPGDATEQRRRGFSALRELLQRLADRRGLVLWVDDLQWGDADSAALLTELLRPPDAPALLFLGGYRTDEAASSALLPRLSELRSLVEVQEIALAPLSEEDARVLAARRLTELGDDPRRAALVARESGGSPFFIGELAQHDVGEGGVAVSQMIARRVRDLDPLARRLLHVVAVAAHALPLRLAAEIAEVAPEERALAAQLRADRLIRTRDVAGVELVESYHDRIRESAERTLTDEERRALHRAIALGLERSGHGESELERLAGHFRDGGEPSRGADYAARAAERAERTMAWEQAARLYRLALALRHDAALDREGDRDLQRHLAEVFGHAGRVVDAADAFLAAAEGAPEEASLELRVRAAHELMIGGHLQRGRELLASVLSAVGLRLPTSTAGLVGRMFLGRAKLAWRGRRTRERDDAKVPPVERLRTDVLWAVIAGAATATPLVTAALQPHYTSLALASGGRRALLRAFCSEAMGIAYRRGIDSATDVEPLLAQAREVAQRLDRDESWALLHMAEGIVAMHLERWRDAIARFEQSEARQRDSFAIHQESQRARLFRYNTLAIIGRTGALTADLPLALQELTDRGNLVASVLVSFWWAGTLLALDRPDDAAQVIETALSRWPGGGTEIPRLFGERVRIERLLYLRDIAGARACFDKVWPGLSGARRQLTHFDWMRSLHLRAILSVAAGDLGEAERDAARIARIPTPAGTASALLLRAAIARGQKNDERALVYLADAERRCDAGGLELLAQIARLRRGHLLGGDQGQALVTGATGWMQAQHVRDPARWSWVFAPGDW